jgi:hypothetical protein
MRVSDLVINSLGKKHGQGLLVFNISNGECGVIAISYM